MFTHDVFGIRADVQRLKLMSSLNRARSGVALLRRVRHAAPVKRLNVAMAARALVGWMSCKLFRGFKLKSPQRCLVWM